jgi:WD40 repeat protein
MHTNWVTGVKSMPGYLVASVSYDCSVCVSDIRSTGSVWSTSGDHRWFCVDYGNDLVCAGGEDGKMHSYAIN